jgi:hypothetical protein
LDEEMSDRIELEHVNRFSGNDQNIDGNIKSPSDETKIIRKIVSTEEMSLLSGNNKDESSSAVESTFQPNTDQIKSPSNKSTKTSADKNERQLN